MIHANSILELFDDNPERLCRDMAAQAKDGHSVPVRCDAAVSWCLIGALYKVYKDDYTKIAEVEGKLLSEIRHRTKDPFMDLVGYVYAAPFTEIIDVIRTCGV